MRSLFRIDLRGFWVYVDKPSFISTHTHIHACKQDLWFCFCILSPFLHMLVVTVDARNCLFPKHHSGA